jgi:outer membrane lipoprotein-sorting protein
MNSTCRSGCTGLWKRARCAFGILLLSPTLLCAAAAPDAREIMAAVFRQDTSHDAFMSASFEVFDKDGHSATKTFSYRRIGSAGDSRTVLAFTDPPELRGVALLSINRPGLSERQFIYVPATQRVRSVAPQQRTARFIGTDFSFEDIEERELDDFNYQLLGDGETMEGHKTRKLVVTPIDAARSQYKFLNYWIAQDAPAVLQIEMYDGQGVLVRVLRASGLRRIQGIWGARRLEMRSVQEGTRTILSVRRVRLNTHPDAALFTPDALGAAQSLEGPQGDDASD